MPSALRIKFFELMKQAMKEDTNQYNNELQGYNDQITAITEKLNDK